MLWMVGQSYDQAVRTENERLACHYHPLAVLAGATGTDLSGLFAEYRWGLGR